MSGFIYSLMTEDFISMRTFRIVSRCSHYAFRLVSHLTHHIYALYALGASPKILEAAFESNASYMRNAIEPPGEINESNWTEHLRDDRSFFHYFKGTRRGN